MTTAAPFLIRSTLGPTEAARNVALRATREVAAYQAFLAERDFAAASAFASLPLTDKAGYLKSFSLEELVGSDFEQTFHIFSSSGSSGHAFYWPQLKASHAASAERLRHLLEGTFRIHERKTLAVVGLALGSWIGGDHFSWLLKSVSIHTPYPFAVFAPGNKHDEIISMLRFASRFVDQFILACCPSAIGHLILRAEQAGTPLPLEKMRYLVIGEPFPESLRATLEARAKLPPGEALMLSIYGSADTGVLGFESPASIALRKLAQAEPGIARELGLGLIIPHFFHQADPDIYLETVSGELCVTKWQGIPLVRYNLHDNALLYDWSEVAARFSDWAEAYPALAPALRQLSQVPIDLPARGLIAITGRADSCLILCGTNITEAMLDQAVRGAELAPFLTGAYQARLLLEEGRQRLGLTLEYRVEAGAAADIVETIYPRLVHALGQVQPEFRDDWASIYRTWDNDPARRILKLHLVAWPGMSRGLEDKIKQRGIVR
jgi:phenylacetate-CoA ligase